MHQPSFRLVYLMLLVPLLFAGCGGGGGDGSTDKACSALNARIFGGESCNQNSRSPVVAIVPVAFDGTELLTIGICTGALVTIDDLITSAHCFTEPLRIAAQQGFQVAGFGVLVGGSEGEVLPLVSVALHPSYNGIAGSAFDVAMATLSSVPNPPIGPLPVLLSELTEPGSQITAFGYGTNQDGVIGELKAADFVVDELLPGNLLVRGDGKTSICPGDSGGPAIYTNAAGVPTIAGINSFGVDDCSDQASELFGFVDLQYSAIVDFVVGYAPDVASG